MASWVGQMASVCPTDLCLMPTRLRAGPVARAESLCALVTKWQVLCTNLCFHAWLLCADLSLWTASVALGFHQRVGVLRCRGRGAITAKAGVVALPWLGCLRRRGWGAFTAEAGVLAPPSLGSGVKKNVNVLRPLPFALHEKCCK